MRITLARRWNRVDSSLVPWVAFENSKSAKPGAF